MIFASIRAYFTRRRMAGDYAVIGITDDRRNPEQRKRDERIERDRADAVLANYIRDRQLAKLKRQRRERLTLITNERDPFQRQAN